MIKRVLPFIHSLHTRCYNFQFSCTDHSVHLAADIQVVMAFQKKEKTQTENSKHSLSAFQTSKIIMSEVVRISYAALWAELPLFAAARCFHGTGRIWVQESISWMFEVLDIALQTAAAPKWHFGNKFLQLFRHCWGHFTSLLLKWEHGSKCYTSNLLSVVHMGISQGHF